MAPVDKKRYPIKKGDTAATGEPPDMALAKNMEAPSQSDLDAHLTN